MKKKKELEKYYLGYFLMESGLKIPVDITEEEGGEKFSVSLCGNMEWPWGEGDIIWLGENSNLIILADRVIGWDINEYEREI